MHLKISTPVKEDYRRVFEKFDQRLFLNLNPPFPPVKLLRFDGSNVNDEVHLELNLLGSKQRWVSLITEFEENEREIYFVDEGIQLPFFLKSWSHRHRIVRKNEHTVIIDDIRFRSPSRILDFIIYPFLFLQFLYRKPVYKRFFGS